MTWSRFDDGYDEHDKIEDAWDADRATVGLHAMATTACNRWQSDGVIKPRWLRGKLPERKERDRVLAVMVEYGLFDLVAAGDTAVRVDSDGDEIELGPFPEDRYIVRGFFKFHDSAAKRDRNRTWDRRRKELERDRPLVDAIRARDKDRCRYCGLLVNWRDRRSPKGGTYDHIIPRGENMLANVVVACRGCNMRKGPRTPEEAGMPLLQAGQVDPSMSAIALATDTTPRRRPAVREATEATEWAAPPTRSPGARKRDTDRYQAEVAAYAAWLFPNVAEPDRSDTVAAALGHLDGRTPGRELTNDNVRRLVRNIVEHGTPFPRPEAA